MCQRTRVPSGCGKVIALVVLLLAVSASPAATHKPVTVVLRFDDYGGAQPTSVDQRIIALSLRYNLSITFGVIPLKDDMPLGRACIEALAPAVVRGKVEVAQHGYTHEAVRNRHGISTEFEGLPYAEQLTRIRLGKEALERAFGLSIETFIPPWNSHDDVTVTCLEQLGFKELSGDAEGPGWFAGRLKAVPATCGLRELRTAIDRARKNGLQDSLVVCLFHGYDFREMDTHRGWLTADEFEEKLAWLAAQSDVDTLTIADAAKRYPRFDGAYQQQAGRISSYARLLPSFLRGGGADQSVYPATAEEVHRRTTSVIVRLTGFNLVIFGGSLMAMWGSSRFLGKRLAAVAKWGIYLVLLLLALSLIYAFHNELFHLRRMLALVIASGLVAGWFVAKKVGAGQPLPERNSLTNEPDSRTVHIG